MNDVVKAEQVANPLEINKERLRQWEACASGTRWFLEKFPQGGMFGEVYNALRDDRRYQDGDWLVERVFSQLDAGAKAVQLVSITGADKAKIEQQVKIVAARKMKSPRPETGRTLPRPAKGERCHDRRRANAATTGYRANAATTGEGANAATTGYRANAATTGNWANAATTGYRANAATTGEGRTLPRPATGRTLPRPETGRTLPRPAKGERCHDRLQGERCHDRKLGERCHDRRRGERCHDRRTRCRRGSWYRRQRRRPAPRRHRALLPELRRRTYPHPRQQGRRERRQAGCLVRARRGRRVRGSRGLTMSNIHPLFREALAPSLPGYAPVRRQHQDGHGARGHQRHGLHVLRRDLQGHRPLLRR